MKSAITLTAAACALALNTSVADAWTMGVLTDTQGAGQYPLVSTRLMDPVVDRFVNHHQIDMLMSVGDLSDRGTQAEFDLWNQHAAPLYDANIPMYIARGNHDVKTESEIPAIDPLFGPVTLRGTELWDANIQVPANPTVTPGPGASYTFAYENTFFINIDVYGTAPSELIGWLTQVALPTAALSGAEHKFLFQHEPWFGKARSGILAADPATELELLTGIAQAGVSTIFVGHDHQYSRSVALDPSGDVLLNHIVTGSNAEKYYRLEEAPGPNEGQGIQINDRVGYSIVEIDGPLVSFTHYDSFAPSPLDTEPWTPEWTVADRFTFASNGDQFFVEADASFAGLGSTSPNGTVATILDGINETYETLTTDPDPGETPQTFTLGQIVNFAWIDATDETLSDILVLNGLADEANGIAADAYTLQLSYDDTNVSDETALIIAFLDEATGQWIPAIDGNLGDADSAAAYTIDTDANTISVTLDHNAPGTRFAVVPEPATALLALTGLAALARRR
ncbi:metallophosphoesterase family protein [Mucisphaera calidilacus]|uniref:Calcineurin-like phosphoesterase n=1 Tax=Mucisphaera calidilacus TaxID=2527982 RepID=A0A518BTA8_9BACT|nr:metallophosphoesterase [Mucisphaera calidilacus]QDU70208.1 Calcineurin-like phosphoesterase [Mucisphaera calidilacus]